MTSLESEVPEKDATSKVVERQTDQRMAIVTGALWDKSWEETSEAWDWPWWKLAVNCGWEEV